MLNSVMNHRTSPRNKKLFQVKERYFQDPRSDQETLKRWIPVSLCALCAWHPKIQEWKESSQDSRPRPWNGTELGSPPVWHFEHWRLKDSVIRLFTALSSGDHGTEHILTDQYKCSRLAIIDTIDTHNDLIIPLCTERWSSQVLSVSLAGCSQSCYFRCSCLKWHIKTVLDDASSEFEMSSYGWLVS